MSAEEIEYYDFRCEWLNAIQHLDVISLGKTRISSIVTPGHTVGGFCYHPPGALFTGDTIFTEGCGICNTTGGNPDKMFESIQMIKTIIDPDIHVYPGHSFGMEPGQTLRYLMKENIYFQITKREHFVNWRMRKNNIGDFNFQ